MGAKAESFVGGVREDRGGIQDAEGVSGTACGRGDRDGENEGKGLGRGGRKRGKTQASGYGDGKSIH